MPYDQKLADRIREALSRTQGDVEEKTMFQGMCFMVNEKMCVCIRDDEMMCRIGPEKYEEALEMNGCHPMIHGGRVMKGFVFVSPEGYKDKLDFDRWIALCLEFNKVAKASKKNGNLLVNYSLKNLAQLGLAIVTLTMLLSCQSPTKEPTQKPVVFPPEKFSVFEGKLDDGRPVIGNINISYRDYEQKSAYPWCLTLNIALQQGNLFENGLPKNEESTIGNKFEDELFTEIKKRAIVHYIGHVYSDGFLDVYFFLDEPKKVNDYLQTQINKEGLVRPFRYEIKEDKEWKSVETYLKIK